jgi:excinuclease UvrABC nuclease subunit
MIQDLCDFLDGRTDPIVSRLQDEMNQAAENLRFERAAALRDQIQAIDRVVEKQKVISNEQADSDVIAMARSNGEACVQIFFNRIQRSLKNSLSNSIPRRPASPGRYSCRRKSKKPISSSSGCAPAAAAPKWS